MRSLSKFITSFLTSAFLWSGNVSAEEPSIVFGPGFKPNQVDSSIDILFSPPIAHIEVAEIAQKNGLLKFYQMPSSDGKPARSVFTVAFQNKSETPGMRKLSEFVNVELNIFKGTFLNSRITQVNMQGVIDNKFKGLDFPYEAFMFQGNLRPGSIEGDSLTLFFESNNGYWSIVWTVPQVAIQKGFPVFERFIKDMVVNKKSRESGASPPTPNTSLKGAHLKLE